MNFKLYIFLFFMGAVMSASSVSANPISLGVEGGVDFSSVDKAVTLDPILVASGYQSSGFTSVTRFTGGVFGEWQFQPSFSLRAEFFYSMKGAQIKTTSPYGNTQSVTNFDYFEIPLLVRYQLPFNWAVKTSVFAGGSYGALLQVQQTFSSNEFSTVTINSAKGFNPGDFNVIGGIEGDWGQWLLDIRYSMGLSQIFIGGPGSGSPFFNAHNMTLTLLAGYRIW